VEGVDAGARRLLLHRHRDDLLAARHAMLLLVEPPADPLLLAPSHDFYSEA
jgi:hypothetical protein